MEVNGHDETTGEEIDWECDADPTGNDRRSSVTNGNIKR
jgi:hypothetical protein